MMLYISRQKPFHKSYTAVSSILLLIVPYTEMSKQKTVVVGAGPVGALAALYAAGRGHEVEVYELRGGMYALSFISSFSSCSFRSSAKSNS
jgi:hypothetical protein